MADLRREGLGTEYATITPAAWRSLCPGTHEGRCWQTCRHAWSQSWLAPGGLGDERWAQGSSRWSGEGRRGGWLERAQRAGAGLRAARRVMGKGRGKPRRLGSRW